MAVWVEKSSKQKEIDDYFSALNCMSLRIIEDIHKVRKSCGSGWEKLTVEEQERKINNWMVPVDVQKQYPDSDATVNMFPVMKMDTGQKLIEYQTLTDQGEVTSTWFDEHSDPFSFETKSQMDLQIPAHDGTKVQRKKSSTDKNKTSKNGVVKKLSENGSMAHESKAKSNGKITKTASTSSKKEKLKKRKSDPKYEPEKETYNVSKDFNLTDFTSDINLNFDLGDVDFSGESYRMPSQEKNANVQSSNGATKGGTDAERNYSAKKSDDYDLSKFQSSTDILPSSELSKPYDESEFLDLYPQLKQDTPKLHDDVTMPKTTKSKGSKAKKVEKKPSQDGKSANPSLAGSKKRSHRKKSSSGSHQVNPRSSLTLDGAIHNLEVASEINKQGIGSDVKRENVFADKQDLLRQIQKDTDADEWFADTSGAASSKDEDAGPQAQKTGFDFLDNW